MNESSDLIERRLSVNGRNAYVVLTANESVTNVNKNSDTPKKTDDSLHLTAKPANRVRFFSEGCYSSTEQTSKEISAPRSTEPVISQTETKVKKTPTQVGMDRYVTVIKRKRSPNSTNMSSTAKILKNSEQVKSQNRFAILAAELNEPVEAPKTFKPPPIYLREGKTNEIVKCLVALIGENSFYVTLIKRGNINEIKIQVNNEIDYRKIITQFEAQKKNFYTYQLKSSKGLKVVIKGIDSCVTPEEVKESLINSGFKIKSVTNIKNKDKVPQPLFRVEMEPGDIKLKKNEIHPIYDLKYLLHRRVVVEEPHKRSGPVQCVNCQEYGHTRAYCKLPAVCVLCGELHNIAGCNKSKADSNVKKCSNCGGNHTANYRGCPVYTFVKQAATRKPEIHRVQQRAASAEKPLTSVPASNQFSYADILKGSQSALTNNQAVPITNHLPKMGASEFNFNRLETTIENLVQSTNTFTNTMSNMMNSFTNSMTNMMTEILRVQQMLLQAVLNKP